MTTKLKTTFILIGTLVIGIIIGALISGTLRQHKSDRIREMHAQDRFLRGMEQIIKPDDEQKDEIKKILEKRFQQLSEVKEKHLTEIAVILDSLHQEMDKVLTKEQKERLERQIDKFSSRMIQSRVDRLAALLQLNDNQIRKIESIYENFEKEMRNRFKKPFKEHFQDKEDIKKLLERLYQDIEEVLIPEQREKYKEMHSKMRPPFDFDARYHFRGRRSRPDSSFGPPFPFDDLPGGRRPRPDSLFGPPPNFE